MSKIDFNALRDRAYKCACAHGFHNTELSNGHLLMLVITELSEAVEADRKGKYFKGISTFEREFNRYSALVDENKRFECAFEKYVKDTVSDEMADAVIRLLDLAGLRGISLEFANGDIDDCIEDMAEACKDETFTESIYSISTLPVRYDGIFDFPTAVNDMILSIFGLAKHLDIDLLWHIEHKMKYNELRENKHGKRY
nr:MAG: dUTPase [Bacteriophage sp.]DAI98737.1 MAG TPA: NTP-PPase-like protein [Caudoviricetes sp.]